jgi:hypothetical protein
MFQDFHSFDPDADSKIPLKRTPIALFARGVLLVGQLLLSRHPMDCWIWLRSMISRRRPLSFLIPWLTFDAIRAIRPKISERWTIFEFGSGHSTLYWAELGAKVVSVENNHAWYELLLRNIRANSRAGIRLIFAGDKFSYVTSIDSCGEKDFDMVLVDGAFRRDCIIAAVRHVKAGGYLIVDNTDWHWFQEQPIEGIPEGWKRCVHPGYAPMMGHRSETTVWVRPESE